MKLKKIFLVLFLGVSFGVFAQCQDDLIDNYLAKAKKVEKINLKEKSAYEQLAKYYQYMCECKNGTDRPKKLVSLINRIVDVNREYHQNKYAVLEMVTSCKTKPSKR